ncbi:MAG: TRAP transporter substrate-binding protein DctP [Planctomycetota bacterium]|nr:MAG: TRAP transporter substrate-binding protein DctP [Planctomycetota bacterium]
MKKILVFFVILVVSIAIPLAWADKASAEKSIPIRYGTDLPPHLPPVVGQHWWADAVTKKTEGRVKVQMYPARSLSTQAGSLQNVLAGVADMYMLSSAVYRKFFPITSLNGLPGAGFPDDTLEANTAHMNTFFELLRRFPAAGAEFNDFGDMFFYVIYSEAYLISKGKRIRLPADVKGLKVGSNGIRLELMEKLGAAPVPDIPPMAYEKLQTGVTQATFAAISAFYDFQLFEVSDYVLDVPFGASGHPIVINKNTWNKISPREQQIMKELAVEGSKRSHIALADLNRKAWQVMIDKGMRTTATKEERQLWENEFKAIQEDWIARNEAAGVKNAREIFNFWKSAADKEWAKQ